MVLAFGTVMGRPFHNITDWL